ncbi:MAG TPA: hypothetical protein V6D19_05455 [Stenomitos sp.]
MTTYEIVDNGANSLRPYQFKVGSYLSCRFVHKQSAVDAAEVYCRWMFGTGRLGQAPTPEFDPTTQPVTVKVARKKKAV